jgi:Fic family protein
VDAGQIPELMDQLFETLGSPHFHQTEKAFMVHFGLQAIQPFSQNDGILGRYWQTLLMEEEYPLFRFVRVDDLTYKYRSEYQRCLFKSVEEKDPTEFIAFMLKITDAAVKEFVVPQRAWRTALERIRYVHKHDLHEFSRKLEHISAPTASRDLALGVRMGFFQRKGTKRLTLYSCLEKDQSRKESQRVYGQNCKDR